jgi:hypothetical protein
MSVQLPGLLAKAFRNIHQDVFFDIKESGADAFDYLAEVALHNLTTSEAMQLKPIIDDLVSGQNREAELQALFNQSPASITFRDGAGVLMLLKTMRRKLSDARIV